MPHLLTWAHYAYCTYKNDPLFCIPLDSKLQKKKGIYVIYIKAEYLIHEEAELFHWH